MSVGECKRLVIDLNAVEDSELDKANQDAGGRRMTLSGFGANKIAKVMSP